MIGVRGSDAQILKIQQQSKLPRCLKMVAPSVLFYFFHRDAFQCFTAKKKLVETGPVMIGAVVGVAPALGSSDAKNLKNNRTKINYGAV